MEQSCDHVGNVYLRGLGVLLNHPQQCDLHVHRIQSKLNEFPMLPQ